jgi:hypothetical protein
MRRLLLVLLVLASLGVPARAVEPVAFTDTQRERIDAVLARFHSQAGPQAFFLGFAGFGEQKVFAEEIELAARQFGAKYGSLDRTLLLINDRRDLEKHPLATVAALQYALQRLGRMMDADDVLFLVLSSHGVRDAMIEVSNTGMPARGLAAEDLARMLRDAGIRWKVVVVSACFSGAFVAPLADARTVVLTAAAKTRASFGCADDRDLTYFGEALYRDALPASATLRSAFETARREIRRRERAERVRPSQPQAHFGAALEPKLEALASPAGARVVTECAPAAARC